MKFLGHLKSRINKSEITIDIHNTETLRNFIIKLVDIVPELRDIISKEDILNNYLILVNDIDINVYGGVDKFIVKNEDIVTLIPIAHGGCDC